MSHLIQFKDNRIDKCSICGYSAYCQHIEWFGIEWAICGVDLPTTRSDLRRLLMKKIKESKTAKTNQYHVDVDEILKNHCHRCGIRLGLFKHNNKTGEDLCFSCDNVRI